MNNKNFNSLSQLKEHKEKFKFSSEEIFLEYLSKIYTNLLQREETINYSKSLKIPKKYIVPKQKEALLALFNNEPFANNQFFKNRK